MDELPSQNNQHVTETASHLRHQENDDAVVEECKLYHNVDYIPDDVANDAANRDTTEKYSLNPPLKDILVRNC